jgi:hypothetical protein
MVVKSIVVGVLALIVLAITSIVLLQVLQPHSPVPITEDARLAYDQCVNESGRVATFFEAYRTRDPLKCEDDALCSAIVAGDESFCEDSFCRGAAMRSFDECDGDELCQAFVSGDTIHCNSYDAIEDADIHHECRAYATKDSEYFTSGIRNICGDYSYFLLANRASKCQPIRNIDMKESCLQRFA